MRTGIMMFSMIGCRRMDTGLTPMTMATSGNQTWPSRQPRGDPILTVTGFGQIAGGFGIPTKILGGLPITTDVGMRWMAWAGSGCQVKDGPLLGSPGVTPTTTTTWVGPPFRPNPLLVLTWEFTPGPTVIMESARPPMPSSGSAIFAVPPTGSFAFRHNRT
jgi:hypothetical protein